MTALNTDDALGDKPRRPTKSRYDRVVELCDLHDPDAIDQGAFMGLYSICETADVLSPAEFYCVAATHFYIHSRKKCVATLASELGCSESTVKAFIESGKKIINDKLSEGKSPLLGHPVMRVRLYPVTDGIDSVLPIAPVIRGGRKVTTSTRLERMSSTLFDADTHFAVSSYYLRESADRLTAKQVAQVLGISTSGVRQKLNECRNVLEAASRFQPDSKAFLSHPMFTREDPYHSNRRLSHLVDDKRLALESRSAQAIFDKASKLDLRYFVPLVRTHFWKAVDKQSLQTIARDMRLAPRAVEEYINHGKEQLRAVLQEDSPLLADHPILRRCRRYSDLMEERMPYKGLFPDNLNAFSSEDLARLTWANVLLNRQAYYLTAWGMSLPERGLKAAFRQNEVVKSVTNYHALIKTLSVSDMLATRAEDIEKKVFGAGIKVKVVRPEATLV